MLPKACYVVDLKEGTGYPSANIAAAQVIGSACYLTLLVQVGLAQARVQACGPCLPLPQARARQGLAVVPS